MEPILRGSLKALMKMLTGRDPAGKKVSRMKLPLKKQRKMSKMKRNRG